MSGWGCRYQVDEQCLRLLRECRPGQPGCVLHGKVTFLRDLEAQPKPETAIAPKKSAGPRPRKRKT
jgi:hypothetical protein